MKKFAFTFVLVAVTAVLMAFLLTGCGAKTPAGSSINNETKEWISPDGVHYWYWSVYNNDGGWSYVLAPRYDYEGNLVKEIHEPKEPDWDLINTKP